MNTIESRAARRLRVLKAGKAVTLNYRSIIDCCVRDISATGAKIICAQQSAVPDEFRLMMPGDNTIREAKVVWRKGEQFGVVFTSSARPAPPRKW
ncbi:MAG TPA: PilZ domain-containing protein [Aestuariivirga sp.]|nr:PilZ domain-containing protein [Aestuariivirga sp.]